MPISYQHNHDLLMNRIRMQLQALFHLTMVIGSQQHRLSVND